MIFSDVDRACMTEALCLAEKGLFTAAPNPRVGCVLAKNGQIVGRGWHRRTGEAHAEIHALREAQEKARGATAYVTLEPCSHFGRTPPCANALIEAGVTRVVAAMEDPNPKVSGRGLESLRAAGVVADCGLLADEARELNLGFISRMIRKRPWVRLKSAASLDGKIALANGQSQWITSEEARLDGRQWRARACAVLTGIGTVKADDPQMNSRGFDTGEREMLKIVLDSALNTPPAARIFEDGKVLIVSASADREKAQPLLDRGVEWLCLPDEEGRVDLPALLLELGRRDLNELHVEAGAVLGGAFISAGLTDELLLYLAPCLLGNSAKNLFVFAPLASLAQRVPLVIREIAPVGKDWRVISRFGGKA